MLLIAAIVIYIPQRSELEFDVKQKLEFIESVKKYHLELKRRWELGDFDNSIARIDSCRNLHVDTNQIGEKYLVCNEDYIDCLLEGDKNKSFEIVKQKNFLGRERNFSIISQANTGIAGITRFGLGITYKNKNDEIQILLDKKCDEIKLEQRIYISPENFQWDNFGKNIFIDRFLVTNRQVNIWIENDANSPASLYVDDPKLWHKPVMRLSLKEKKMFCAFHGKRLMERHYFDAAVNIPSVMENPKNRFLKMYKFYWTKNHKNVFPYLAKNTQDIDSLVTLKNCKKIFSKECLEKYNYKYFDTDSVTWSGIYQVMGGYPELIINRRSAQMDYRNSSFYLNLDSDEHQVGKASYKADDIQEYAFRCMREE